MRRVLVTSATAVWTIVLVAAAAWITADAFKGDAAGTDRLAFYLLAGTLIGLAVVIWTYRLVALMTSSALVVLVLVREGPGLFLRHDWAQWPMLAIVIAGLLYIWGWLARWSTALVKMRDQLERIKQARGQKPGSRSSS
ncbi:MAG: hypothetical protein ABIF71_10885 [Planctomycetota bacterium]